MSNDDDRYQYVLEIYKKDGQQEHVGTFAVKPDWEPAREGARFAALRRARSLPLVLRPDVGRIEPHWDAQAGMPWLQGVRVIVPQDARPDVAFDVPLEYFGGLARTASSALIKSGKLVAGEAFQYFVCAYERRQQPCTGEDGAARFAIEPTEQVLNASDLEMDGLLADSSPCGSFEDGELPVFLPAEVIEEAVALMQQAGDKETGGILIGHLRRDPGRRELFLQVTAQIAAQHAEQELTRLTFTPETWTAVDAALALRGAGEMYLGWWHSHPASHWCQECPPEKRRQCTISGATAGDFFSEHDRALHRAVFPRAYSIALVISDGCAEAATPVWRLFGWRQGMIRARGFHQLCTAGQSAQR